MKVGFEIVGHTHDIIDQVFSRVSVYLGKHATMTIPELMGAIKKSYTVKLKKVTSEDEKQESAVPLPDEDEKNAFIPALFNEEAGNRAVVHLIEEVAHVQPFAQQFAEEFSMLYTTLQLDVALRPCVYVIQCVNSYNIVVLS